MKKWHEEDEFWEKWRRVMFTEERWSNAEKEISEIIDLLKIEPGSNILDLCCGPGRHSLELAKLGFKVTGVDRTHTYLAEAQKRASNANLSIEFILQDMRTYCNPDSYDAVLNLFTSFGYFEDAQDDKQVVGNVYESLKEGGRFLIELMSKEVLARLYRERDWYETDGVLVLEENKLIDNWSKVESRWRMIDGTERSEQVLRLRLYSASELVNLMKTCGFREVKAYGNLGGAEYDHKAERLVVVGLK